jgi:hypothetical protein
MLPSSEALGKRFDRLVVTRVFFIPESSHALADVICDCGNTLQVKVNNLRTGNTTSCGCYRVEWRQAMAAKPKAPRIRNETAEYRAWTHMLGRCYTPTDGSYRRYGGRGISVCDRWRTSYQNFLADMGPRPEDCSLDRIDNDGNYTPENCRWATRAQQSQNRSSNRHVEYAGRRWIVSQLAEHVGLPYEALRRRLDRGWSVEEAVSKRLRINNIKIT